MTLLVTQKREPSGGEWASKPDCKNIEKEGNRNSNINRNSFSIKGGSWRGIFEEVFSKMGSITESFYAGKSRRNVELMACTRTLSSWNRWDVL